MIPFFIDIYAIARYAAMLSLMMLLMLPLLLLPDFADAAIDDAICHMLMPLR